MKKLHVILIGGVICLVFLVLHNKLPAQSPDNYSCIIEESYLEEWEIWEENSVFCYSCELDGDGYPVYDSNGVIIGYWYETSPQSHIEDEVVCGWIEENTTESCNQRLVFDSSDDECHPRFVPIP